MAAFGNTPLAKAVAFTPVVAGYIYYSKTYLEANWGFQNALWLYWSLIFLSIGQWIYIWRAPVEVKRFRDNEAQYIDQALTTWSEKRFDQEATAYLQKQMKFTLHTIGSNDFPKFRQELRRVLPVPQRGHDPDDTTRRLLSSLAKGDPIRPNVSSRRMHTDRINAAIEELQGQDLTDQQASSVEFIARFLNQPTDSQDWKKEILEDLFKTAQSARRNSMLSVCALYGFGSAYFIVNTTKTVWNIASLTFQ